LHYVYILQSKADERRFYTGLTDDLRKRLESHNAGRVPHTAKWKPWRLKTYIAFHDRSRASEFEQYLSLHPDGLSPENACKIKNLEFRTP
jgi:putative endonuclease